MTSTEKVRSNRKYITVNDAPGVAAGGGAGAFRTMSWRRSGTHFMSDVFATMLAPARE
jgi:hypothetical protein